MNSQKFRRIRKALGPVNTIPRRWSWTTLVDEHFTMDAQGRWQTTRRATDREVYSALDRRDGFHYMGKNKQMFYTWSLGPRLARREDDPVDSMQLANDAVLLEFLAADRSLNGEYEFAGERYWLTFRVLDGKGKPTRMMHIIMAWKDMLEAYPIVDEEIYGQYSLEAWDEAVDNCIEYLIATNKLIEELPEDFTWQVRDILGESDNDVDSVTEERVLEIARELNCVA